MTNAYAILHQLGLRLSCYNPDDGRIMPLLPTEAGCIVSHLNALIAAQKHNLESILILEDDAILSNNFKDVAMSAIAEAPDGWDFISFGVCEEMNLLTAESDLGLELLHKSIMQMSCAAAIMYSYNGIRHVLKHFTTYGVTYNYDSILYRASSSGLINGYILKNNIPKIITHRPDIYISDIDPENLRNTENMIT